MLGIYNSPSITVIGLAIMGFGCGLIIIPIMPDMIEAAEENDPNIDETVLHNNISGLFIAFQGIGETAGPILGSVLEDTYGFRLSQDFMALGVLFFLILYFFCCGRFSLFEIQPAPKAHQHNSVYTHSPMSAHNASGTPLRKTSMA